MKPEWKDAPEWAKFLAQDSDGTWYWYESQPVRQWGNWKNAPGSRYEQAYYYHSPEQRPQTTKPAEAGSEGQGA
jgi:hypothetical protein